MTRLNNLLQIFVALSAASVALAQSTKLLTPRSDSPTAMRRCGAELEKVKTQDGLTRRYVFTGNEVLRNMQYCVVEAGGAVRIANTSYHVPAGTVGWTNSEGTKVVLEECVNGADCEGCSPEPEPKNPPKAEIPPENTQPPQRTVVAKVASAVCMIDGNPWAGYNFTFLNGVGHVTSHDGNEAFTEHIPPIGNLPAGEYRIRGWVNGSNFSRDECERTWKVEEGVLYPFAISPDGRPGWSKIPFVDCFWVFGKDIKHDWGWSFVWVERIGCVADAVIPFLPIGGAVAEGVKNGRFPGGTP